MKFLEKRPAPNVNNKVVITRVRGGYIVEIDGLTTPELKYHKNETVIAKSLSEVLIIIKNWSLTPEEIDNGTK